MDKLRFGDSPDQRFVHDQTFHQAKMAFLSRFPPDWKIGYFPDRVSASSLHEEGFVELRLTGPVRCATADVL
jgi:predicted Zn-dependent protease